MTSDVRDRLLRAARECLLTDGYATFSTRRVADRARSPVSQIHYHFGGKPGLVLALLEQENERLVARQATMYGSDVELSRRYEQACDFLEEDLASGYVRLLHEMIAAGWSDPAVAGKVGAMLEEWFSLLHDVVEDSRVLTGDSSPLGAGEVALLIGMSFLGGEALILLDDRRRSDAVRSALRAVGDLIRRMERHAAP